MKERRTKDDLRALKVKWICETILEIAFLVFLAYALQACLRHCAG